MRTVLSCVYIKAVLLQRKGKEEHTSLSIRLLYYIYLQTSLKYFQELCLQLILHSTLTTFRSIILKCDACV